MLWGLVLSSSVNGVKLRMQKTVCRRHRPAPPPPPRPESVLGCGSPSRHCPMGTLKRTDGTMGGSVDRRQEALGPPKHGPRMSYWTEGVPSVRKTGHGQAPGAAALPAPAVHLACTHHHRSPSRSTEPFSGSARPSQDRTPEGWGGRRGNAGREH